MLKLIVPLKMTLMCRERYIELIDDDDDDNPKDELLFQTYQ